MSKSAENAFGAALRAVLVDGTFLATPNQSLFWRMGGLDVCDDAHWWFVMKKVKGPAQAKLGRATRLPSDLWGELPFASLLSAEGVGVLRLRGRFAFAKHPLRSG